MNLFRTLTSNYVLNVGVVAWVLAQLIKTVLTLIVTKELVLERLTGAGGMPSSHSALACSVAVAMAKKLGFSSPEFGLALCFALVVMYDAMGVRRAAGEQAKVLNRIAFELPPIFEIFSKQNKTRKDDEPEHEQQPQQEKKPDHQQAEREAGSFLEKKLQEYLGHTPVEVLGGMVLGILVAVFMPVT